MVLKAMISLFYYSFTFVLILWPHEVFSLIKYESARQYSFKSNRYRLFDKINVDDVNEIQNNRPPIIMFNDDESDKKQSSSKKAIPEGVNEFARKDLPPVIPKYIQDIQNKLSTTLDQLSNSKNEQSGTDTKSSNNANVARERSKRISTLANTSRDNDGNIITNNEDRPSGYDNDEYDPNDEPNYPDSLSVEDRQLLSKQDDDKNFIIRFLNDVAIESEYDSRNKRQAKYIVRSISGISLVIGIIFTIVWYAFPGKFISYRENRDFSSRYPSVQYDPDDLLKNNMQGFTLFEDPQLKPLTKDAPSLNNIPLSEPLNNSPTATKITTTTNDLNDDSKELVINREVQRFQDSKTESDYYYKKYVGKPTIEL